MKLLIQSDDFGLTKGTARGALRAIREGPVRNTGLFANMPWAEEVVKWTEPVRERIAFGIDLNSVNGPSVLGHEQVPSLCREDGTFLSIRENRQLDTEENGYDHTDEEELTAEYDAQIRRFRELTGTLPDYIHPHAYVTAKIQRVQRKLAEKYHIPYSFDLSRIPGAVIGELGWYTNGTMEQQLEEDPLTYFLEDRNGYLKHEYGLLITHCAELDSETLRLPFNICRLRDLEAVTDSAFLKWLDDNQVDLITYNDIRSIMTD